MKPKFITNQLVLAIIFSTFFCINAFSNQFLDWQFLGPNNFGGMTKAILVDKNDSNLIYAGSAGGGLHISFDAGDSWQAYQYNHLLNNCAIGSIKQAANGTIVLSTGEPDFGYSTNVIGAFIPSSGLFKIFNPNNPPQFIAATDPINNSDFLRINEIELHPLDTNIIYVATNNGVRRTNDSGLTWFTPVFSPNATSTAYDIKIARRDDGTDVSILVYATVGSNTYRSIDGGLNFLSMANAVSCLDPNFTVATSGSSRKEIAISSKNPLYAYVSIVSASGQLQRVIRTTDGGSCWEVIGTYDQNYLHPFTNGDYSAGSYYQALTIDPNNENKIFLGGLTIWTWNNIDDWSKITTISNFGNYPNYVPDGVHNLTFDPNNSDNLYVSTVSGIYKTTNASDSLPNFDSKNNNYITTQFKNVAADFAGRVMGSTFANSCVYLDYPQTMEQNGTLLISGITGNVEISHLDEAIMFFATNVNGLLRSSNIGASVSSFMSSGDETTYLSNSIYAQPFHLWEDVAYWQNLDYSLTNPQKMDSVQQNKKARFYSGSNRMFVVDNPLDLSNIANTRAIGQFAAGVLTDLNTSKDGDALWAGSTNGSLIRVTGLNDLSNYIVQYGNSAYNSSNVTVWATSNLPWSGGYISSVNVNPSNSNQALVTFASYNVNTPKIYLSNNALSSDPTWTNIQLDFETGQPIYDAIFDETAPNRIFIATEIGVWSLEDFTSSLSWTAENDDLGRCRITQINQEAMNHPDCPVIYISTYGKGLLRSTKSLDDNPVYSFCDTALPVYLDFEDFSNTGFDKNLDLKFSPNPMNDLSKLTFHLNENANTFIAIYDINGKKVQSYQLGNLNNGTHTIDICREELTTGNYVVLLSAKGKITSGKLIVE